ncbi:MAG: MFS transporter [Planctomycetes bacterium]|nr:MFS transporter [Planctomycetota bacterium]
MALAPTSDLGGNWLSRNVLVLGLISLLTDSASEMIVPLLPVYLTAVIGGGAVALGLIEGVAELTASIVKLFAGRWADKVGRNRPFVIAGYSLASFVRPLVAFALASWHIVLIRSIDRVGKGLRSGPRDSLIAASVKPEQRGAAFGLHRAMDNAGAVIGPLIAAAFLYWGSRDPQNLRTLFLLTFIPGALVILAALIGVKELPKPAPEAGKDKPRGLVRFLIPLALFTLGNSTDLFLIMRVAGEKPDIVMFPLMWAMLSFVKAAAGIPGGKLADKFGRRRVIVIGWLLYAGIYAAFGFTTDTYVMWGLLAAYGVYYGLTEGAERALIAEIAPRDKRGAAYGWYYFTLGILALVASVLFGALWEVINPQAAFLTGAGLALAACVALVVLARTAPGTA